MTGNPMILNKLCAASAAALTVALAIAGASPARATGGGPPFNVDDPATSERGFVDLTLNYAASRAAGSQSQQVPSLSLSYGLKQTVELDLGLGMTSFHDPGARNITGWGDMTSGIRWRFREETAHAPQAAIGYQVKLPTASKARGLGTGAVDHSLWLTAAKSYGRATVASNVGYNVLGDSTGRNNLFYGVCATFQMTETLTIGAQVFGNDATVSDGSGSDLAWGVGMTRNYGPDRSFLLHIGRSERGNSDLSVFAGVSFTLGKVEEKK